MITGESGGFISRMMPPVDYNHGEIPALCYDKSLSCREIEGLLLSVYCTKERIRALADSDEPIELLRAELAIEIVAEMDAGTIWTYNQLRKD